MIPTPPRAAVPAQPDARPLVKILAENWKVWPAGQAVEQTSLGDVYCSTRGRSLMFGTHEIAIDQGTAVVTKDMWATQAALTAAQPTHEQIAAYLQATGTYVTNDATREAAIADAIAADRASQGAAERAVPAEFLRGVIALCTQRGFSPENIEAWDKGEKWIADLWRQAETMLAAVHAHFQTPAQTEHVAADVSQNGLESNTAGAVPERIAATWLTDPTPTPERQFCEWLNSKRGCNVSEVFHEIMQRFASHAQAPAGAAAQMSAEAVRALPAEARAYIHQLEANTDPAGMVRENMQLCDTNAGLQAMYRNAADALKEVIGCFGAASDEGLAEALAETTDERLKDLLERRLMHALYAAQEAVAEPTTAQAAPAAGAVAGPNVDLPTLGVVPASMADHPGILALMDMVRSICIINKQACWNHSAMFDVRDALCATVPTPAAQADSGVQEDARAVSTALYQARCDTPKYCSSVQRCTAMDSQRAIKSEARND